MVTDMSRMELIGFITATAHTVASSLKANYRIHGNMRRGFITIELSNFKSRKSFMVNLNEENIQHHFADVAANIQNTEL